MTPLTLMARGWLNDGLTSVSLHTHGWLGTGAEAQTSAGYSSSAGSAGSGGPRWIPHRIPSQTPQPPGFLLDIDDLGLHISVQTGAEMSKADIYDMIALSIAEELYNLNKKLW